MSDRILYVDDDSNILAACRRSLGRKLKITTAGSGKQGLSLIRSEGPFAAILSDMRMPEMDGIEFICAARVLAPDTVCMMLTGNSDQETAMNAVNQGQIFRFLTKPCPQETLEAALNAALAQYRLVTAERELLQGTLMGSVRALTEVLSLVHPKVFARSSRIRAVVRAIVEEMDLRGGWQYQIAAMLAQIGCIVLPTEAIDKAFAGTKLSSDESAMFATHPEHGCKLLGHIPRLEKCARMIGNQTRRFDAPLETPEDEASALGAQILHVAIDYDARLSSGLGRRIALDRMREDKGEYSPAVLAALERVSIEGVDEEIKGVTQQLSVWQLAPGMIALADIYTTTGMLLMPKGGEIRRALIQRLRNFASGIGIQEPVTVLVPDDIAKAAA
jgi:response regulator RpfG family c-di-GMP phosphodiesterase